MKRIANAEVIVPASTLRALGPNDNCICGSAEIYTADKVNLYCRDCVPLPIRIRIERRYRQAARS